MNILKFVKGSSTVMTKQLDSMSYPFFFKGPKIEIATEHVNPRPSLSAAVLPSALDRMMGTSEPTSVRYLKWDAVQDPKIDDQIREWLYQVAEAGELRYFNISQRKCLKDNLYNLSDIVCFIGKHWKKLLNANFPSIPSRTCSDSLLLEIVGQGSPKQSSNGRLTISLVATHCGTLAQMPWLSFKKSNRLKRALGSF